LIPEFRNKKADHIILVDINVTKNPRDVPQPIFEHGDEQRDLMDA
jgi:hypothetical protein